MSIQNELPPVAPAVGAEARALNEQFDKAGVVFHDRPAALAAFKEHHEIVFQDGVPHSTYDGVLKPLSACLLAFGYDNRNLVDGRTLPREGVVTAAQTLNCPDPNVVFRVSGDGNLASIKTPGYKGVWRDSSEDQRFITHLNFL